MRGLDEGASAVDYGHPVIDAILLATDAAALSW